MGKSSKRKKYFVHPSSQLKYVAFSILPALIMTLFCTYFFNVSGKLVFEIQTDTFFAQLSSIKKTMKTAESVATKETQDSIRKLKDLLDSFEDSMLLAYTEAPKKWKEARLFVLAGLFSVLLGTSILALLYSHRIAGPLFRLRKCVDMLSAGQDVEPIRFRKKDEFKELAESLNELRITLKDKGFLQSQD
jgi:nitrogen fixation/metabolism regulation signal transduction histidine kinase